MNKRCLVVWVSCVVFGLACAAPPDVEADSAPFEEPREAPPAVRREAVVVPIGPDLQVMSVSSAVTAVARNTSRAVSVTVCNHGSEEAPSSTVSVLVSLDTTLNASDPVVGSATVPLLAPAACTTVSVTATFSPATGTYSLGAWADRADALNEEVESNNTLRGPSLYIGNRADVTVSVLSAPTSAPASTAFVAQLRACNLGSSAASSTTLSVRRSTDTTINSSDTSLGSSNIGSLAAGACQNVNVSASSATVNELYLGALVTTSSTEVSTANNSALAGRFAAGNRADLIIEASSRQLIGSALQTTATVCNRGYVNAAASTLSTHLSVDATYDASDIQLGTIAIPLLAANTCITVTQTHALPAVTATRIPLARVDATSVITELFESNNVNAGSSLTLGPDLHVTAFNVVHDGSVFVADAVVCNDGTVNAAASVLGVLQSNDQLADASDSLVSSIATPAVAAGACVAVSGNFSVLSAPGQFTFIARTDEAGLVNESNETNNTRYSAPTGINADFVVTSTTSWVQDGAVWWNVRVCNQGNLSGAPSVDLRLSTDALFDPQDELVNSQALSQLAPGACVDLTGNAQTMTRGTRQLVVSIDVTDELPESNEANNGSASAAFFIGTHVTLANVATAVSWSGFANVFTVTGTLCNEGSLTADTFIDAALSPDTVRDWNDTTLSVVSPDTNFRSLLPGACEAFSLPFTSSSTPDGERHVLITTPADDAHAGEFVINGPFTLNNDLVVSNANVVVSWNGSENQFTLSAQVCNVGTRPAQSSPRGRLGLNTVQGWNDISLDLVDPYSLPPSIIEPGQCAQVSALMRSAYANIPDGTYFVFFEQMTSGDTNLANNVAMVPTAITLRNDLVVSNANVVVSWNGSENQFTLSAQVCNVGTRPAQSGPRGRLGLNTVQGWNDISLDLVDPYSLPPSIIEPGQCTQVSALMRSAYANIPDGTYFVFFEQMTSGDANLANNVAMVPTAITLRNDLVVSNANVVVSWNGSENQFTLSAQVCNVGTRPAQSGPRGRLGLNTVQGWNDISLALVDPYSLPPSTIAPGQCAQVSALMRSTYANIPDGTYFVFFEQMTSGDAILANNVAMVPTAITLRNDLVVSNANVVVSWTGSENQFTLSAQVCNVGTRPAQSGPRGRLGLNTVQGWNDISLALVDPYSLPPSIIEPGQCAQVSALMRSAYANIPDGTYFVFFEQMTSGDANLANNVAMVPTAITLGNDLAVSNVVASSAWNGTEFRVSLRAAVCNIGTRPAQSSPRGRLGLSTVQSWNDIWLQPVDSSRPPDVIAPGQCTGVSAAMHSPYAPIPDGTYFVFFEQMTSSDGNFTNNIAMASAALSIGVLDLAVSNVTSAVSWNGSSTVFTLSAQVCNIGTLAGKAYPRGSLSTDTIADASDIPLLPIDPASPTLDLAPGQCKQVTRTLRRYTTPPVQPGSYFVFFEYYSSTSGADVNTANNVSMAPVAVTVGPDLNVTDASVSVTQNGMFHFITFTVQVCNVGTSPGVVTNRGWLSTDATLEPATDIALRTISSDAPTISPGQCLWQSVMTTEFSPVSAGWYHVFFQAQTVGDPNPSNDVKKTASTVAL